MEGERCGEVEGTHDELFLVDDAGGADADDVCAEGVECFDFLCSDIVRHDNGWVGVRMYGGEHMQGQPRRV